MIATSWLRLVQRSKRKNEGSCIYAPIIETRRFARKQPNAINDLVASSVSSLPLFGQKTSCGIPKCIKMPPFEKGKEYKHTLHLLNQVLDKDEPEKMFRELKKIPTNKLTGN